MADTEAGERPGRLRRALGAVPVSRLGLPRGVLAWVCGVLALAAVALLVLSLVQLSSLRTHDRLQDRRTAATRAASEEVRTLLTTSTSTSKKDIAALQDGATAGFRTQLTQFASTYLKTISQNGVTATGTVEAAAPSSINGARDSAVVLVAATYSVSSKANTTPQRSNFRFSLTMKLVDGRWLVAGLAPVA